MRCTQVKAIVRDLEKRRGLLSGPRQVGKYYLARSIAEGFSGSAVSEP
jgi:predicted AAA+ superfamily ATPase